MTRLKHANHQARALHNKLKATEQRRFLKVVGALEDTNLTYRTLQKAKSESKLTPCFIWGKLLGNRTFDNYAIKRRFAAYVD